MKRPGELYLTRGANGTRVRFSTTVGNVGTGPLEIFPAELGEVPLFIRPKLERVRRLPGRCKAPAA